ncbi:MULTISPECIES: hypothetical protein [unclassified Bradyrhizobium]
MTDVDPAGATPQAPATPQQDPATTAEKLLMRRIELSAAPIGRMINVISLIAGIIAVAVIGSVITLAIIGKDIPDQLSNWGGIILGFYFGQFINLVKDYMGIIQTGQGGTRSA